MLCLARALCRRLWHRSRGGCSRPVVLLVIHTASKQSKLPGKHRDAFVVTAVKRHAILLLIAAGIFVRIFIGLVNNRRHCLLYHEVLLAFCRRLVLSTVEQAIGRSRGVKKASSKMDTGLEAAGLTQNGTSFGERTRRAKHNDEGKVENGETLGEVTSLVLF